MQPTITRLNTQQAAEWLSLPEATLQLCQLCQRSGCGTTGITGIRFTLQTLCNPWRMSTDGLLGVG
jgi:hypothetical protein